MVAEIAGQVLMVPLAIRPRRFDQVSSDRLHVAAKHLADRYKEDR